MRYKKSSESGYVMLGALVLVGLALIVTAGMLDSAATNSKTRALVNTQSQYYYEVEATLSRTVAWLQQNSTSIVGAFTADNFQANFDLGPPSFGANEGEHFGVPTMVKMSGTNNSVMLTNNPFFGTPAFPSTTNISTGSSFNAINAFQNADLGSANARLILVWARETNGNYQPVFRVDVVTGNNPDRGVHSYSYVFSHLVTGATAVGFYGRDYLTFQTPNNSCFSYQYTFAGSWSRGAPRTNCPIASNGLINISSSIHGTAATLQGNGISLNPPGGSVSGDICHGGGCHNYVLPTFDTWNEYCPGNTDDRNINANTTLSGGCYRDISIANKRLLTLNDHENPYYIRSLNFTANFARFDIGIIPEGEEVEVFVETLSNNHINGNQFYNVSAAPHQLRLNYIGDVDLQLNGTAAINALIVAPKVHMTVNGNFTFYGGIMARSLLVSGNARVNYDETALGEPALTDMTFALKKTSQRYR